LYNNVFATIFIWKQLLNTKKQTTFTNITIKSKMAEIVSSKTIQFGAATING